MTQRTSVPLVYSLALVQQRSEITTSIASEESELRASEEYFSSSSVSLKSLRSFLGLRLGQQSDYTHIYSIKEVFLFLPQRSAGYFTIKPKQQNIYIYI